MTVLDLNDNPPAFNSSIYNLTVFEETKPGTVVGLVTATDPDMNTTVYELTFDWKLKMSNNVRNRTFRHVRPAKIEISLCICVV